MAGLEFILRQGEIALVAATAKTVLQAVAPANHRVKIKEWGVFFDGTSVTGEPVVVQIIKQTTAGTMSALTPTKRDSSLPETVLSTAQHTATVEPTTTDIIDEIEVHPQAGYEKIFPLGSELWIPGGERRAIRCTAPANVNVNAKMVCEE